MMQCLKIIVIVGVLMKGARGYSFYPGIFDPNPFIPRMHPEVLKITSSALHEPIYVLGSNGGDKEDEIGYVKSDSEKGAGGYHHVETFHKKDGNDYDYEYESGKGESKDDENYDDQEPNLKKRGSDEAGEVGNYEVMEEHGNDHHDPHQHTKYGVKPTKPSKKPVVPEFGTRLVRPKKTTLKKNDNGYETVVYHGLENESSEKGFDWRKHPYATPKNTVNQKTEDPQEDLQDAPEDDMEAEKYEKEEHDEESNEEDHNDQRQPSFGDNYGKFKYDLDFHDFSKNFNDEDENDRSEENESDKGGRSSFGRNNYDYDDEVDREEVDEAANEDRYQGEEYDDDSDYGKKNRRSYDYASDYDTYW